MTRRRWSARRGSVADAGRLVLAGGHDHVGARGEKLLRELRRQAHAVRRVLAVHDAEVDPAILTEAVEPLLDRAAAGIEGAGGRARVEVLDVSDPRAPADASRIAESVREQLRRLNSEFAPYVPAERQLPDVVVRPAGDPEYFPVGVKHRYTRRS